MLAQTLTTIFALFTVAAADCSDFTQATTKFGNDFYTSTENVPDPKVSRGYVCDQPNLNYEFNSTIQKRCNSTQCATTSYGVVNILGVNNLSLSDDQAKPLYKLITSKTGSKEYFPAEVSGNVSQLSGCLDVAQNSSGYYIFSPYFKCVEGTLSGCKNGPVADGTAIKICAPDTFGQQHSPNGWQHFLTTDAAAAANVTSNPAATVTPEVDNSKDSAAGRVGFGWDLGSFGVAFWLACCFAFGIAF